MPTYHVTLHGNAWVKIVRTVEAEDEKEAIQAALASGSWIIDGDVERAGEYIVLDEQD